MAELLGLVSLFWALRRFQPTLVHAITIKAVLYAGIAGRLLGISRRLYAVSGLGYVFMERSLKAQVIRALVRPVYGFIAHGGGVRFIFQNRDDQAQIRDFLRWPPTRMAQQSIVTAGSGVDLNQFSPALGWQSRGGAVRFVCATRLLKAKGVGEYIDAARQVLAGFDTDDVHRPSFTLAGGLDEANQTGLTAVELDKLLDSSGVEYVGHQDNMAAFLRGFDVSVLLSHREGFPKALIEAAASGLGIITTDVPGCRELKAFAPDATTLVAVQNLPAAAQAFDKLARDPAGVAKMKQAARQAAEQHFGVEKIVESHMALYEIT